MSQTIHSAAPAHPLGLDFAADFGQLGAYLRDHPVLAARFRSARHLSIPLVGASTAERLADLHGIAREMGTAVDWRGSVFATDIRFGAVTLEAHHSPTAFLTIQGVRR